MRPFDSAQGRPKCPKCSGLLRHDPSDTIGPERVTCPLCGWVMLRHEEASINVEKQEEPAISNRPRGTCSSCGRDGLTLLSHMFICSRCYKRSRKGLDVHADNHSGWRSKNPRGTCPLCKREDVLLTSTNGECQRCYKRIASGHNPLSTTRPMPLLKTSEVLKTSKVCCLPIVTLVFTGENLDVIQRFSLLSGSIGGPIADDICTILDLYLDKKLMLREAA